MLEINEIEQSSKSISLDLLLNFLKHFGHFLESICWCKTIDNRKYQDIVNMIADSCGKTLKRLKIDGHTVYINAKSPFEVLEIFGMQLAELRNFNSHSQLKCLYLCYLDGNQYDWLTQQFPTLEVAEFIEINELKDNMLSEFLRLNPQLQVLKIKHCNNVTSAAILFSFTLQC